MNEKHGEVCQGLHNVQLCLIKREHLYIYAVHQMLWPHTEVNLYIQVPLCIFCLKQPIMVFNSCNILNDIFLMFNLNSSFVCICFCPDAKERTTRSFSVGGVFNYTSLLLSKEDNKLYVGAREILFALNLSDISAVKLQRNVRASELASVNRSAIYRIYCINMNVVIIGSQRFNLNIVIKMIRSQKSNVNITHMTVLKLQYESDSVSLSCSSHGKLQRGREMSAVLRAKTCR